MAKITVPDENREITDVEEIREFLAPFGIWYEKWEVEGRIGPEATNDEILDAYSDEIERLKAKGGFVTADVINVTPETPGLDAMCAKFADEHTHSEDEVRFTVKGRGVFHVNPANGPVSNGPVSNGPVSNGPVSNGPVSNGPVFGVTVESGDLINVPRGTRHWFNLCSDKTIRCIRLFEDASGWAPHYVDDPVHQKYASVCWGPDYLPPARDMDPVVKV